MPIGGEHDGVTVGRSFCHAGSARDAGAVLDNDGLIPNLRKLVSERARQDVSRAAGRDRDDDAHRLVGKWLCRIDRARLGKCAEIRNEQTEQDGPKNVRRCHPGASLWPSRRSSTGPPGGKSERSASVLQVVSEVGPPGTAVASA